MGGAATLAFARPARAHRGTRVLRIAARRNSEAAPPVDAGVKTPGRTKTALRIELLRGRFARAAAKVAFARLGSPDKERFHLTGHPIWRILKERKRIGKSEQHLATRLVDIMATENPLGERL